MNLFQFHRDLAEQPFYNEKVVAIFVTQYPTSVINMLKRVCEGYYNKYHKRNVGVIYNEKTKIYKIYCRTEARLLFLVKEKK